MILQKLLNYFSKSNNKQIRKLKKQLIKDFPDIHNHIIENYDNYMEGFYCVVYNVTKKPRCRICGNFTKFIDFDNGYEKYCTEISKHIKKVKDINI